MKTYTLDEITDEAIGKKGTPKRDKFDQQLEAEMRAYHIGEAIKKELERQGKTVVWFAEQLPCHRTNVYRIFEKASIDTHILMRISEILKHDFFTDHSKELKV